MVRSAKAAKNSTAIAAWVDIAFSATIRSEIVGPAASRIEQQRRDRHLGDRDGQIHPAHRPLPVG